MRTFENDNYRFTMYIEAKKIHLIAELLKENDEATLHKVETVLKNSRRKPSGKQKKPSIYNFLGILSKKDAAEIKKAIKETSETIHPDDWK